MYLLLALFLITFELLYEGLKMKGKHILSEMIEFIERGVIVILLFGWITAAIPTLWPLLHSGSFLKIIIGYLFLRFGIFDPLINLVSGQPINSIGTTKLWDLSIRWFLHKLKWKGQYVLPPEHFIFIRFIFTIWGILWLIV